MSRSSTDFLFSQARIKYDGSSSSLGDLMDAFHPTNAIPSDSDALKLRTCLDIINEDMDNLNAEIDQAGEYLRRLNGLRAGLAQLQARVTGVLSAIHRLPPEILAEIFVFCCWKNTFDDMKPPWTLGRVCQQWRSVALTTPALWKTVWLRPSDHISLHLEPIPRSILLLKEYIRRNSTSIDLNLYCARPDFQSSDSHTLPAYQVLEHLITHSARWGKVRLFLDTASSDILRSIKDPLSMLTSLSIWWPAEVDSDVSPLGMFRLAPRLRSACIYTPLQICPLPLAQLETLDIRFDSPLTSYEAEALQSLSSLHDLGLAVSGVSPSFPAEPLNLPQILSLTISKGVDFLDHLLLPSLQNLSLVLFSARECASLAHHCRSLVVRSQCNVTHLEVQRMLITSSDLIEIFRALPSVTSLVMGDVPKISSDLFIALGYTPGLPCIFPSLERLRVQNLNNELLVPFLDFVESRCNMDESGFQRLAELKDVVLVLTRLQSMSDFSASHRSLFMRPGFKLIATQNQQWRYCVFPVANY